MKSYLVLGLPHEDLKVMQWVRSLGFTGVRHGLRMTDDWDHIRMVFDTFKKVPELSPLFLLPLEQDYQDPLDVLEFTETVANMIEDWGFDREDVALEFCNEPNIFSNQWKTDPERLGKLFVQAIPRIRKWAKNIKILTPSISNLDRNSIVFANRLFAPIKKEASDYHLAFHRYPAQGHLPHAGFGSRLEELETFVATVGDGRPRELWLTETGYSQWAYQPRGFPLCFLKEKQHRTEQRQAEFCAIEYAGWHDMGINAVTWYQLNDGPEAEPLDGYGIRYVDGTPKIVSQMFKMLHRELSST